MKLVWCLLWINYRLVIDFLTIIQSIYWVVESLKRILWVALKKPQIVEWATPKNIEFEILYKNLNSFSNFETIFA